MRKNQSAESAGRYLYKYSIFLSCIQEQECKCFCGGDKAMRSLGNCVCYIVASICNFLEYFGQMAQNSPTAYG